MAGRAALVSWLFPAHAGVILAGLALIALLLSIPRTRGGDPVTRNDRRKNQSYSPHTRG